MDANTRCIAAAPYTSRVKRHSRHCQRSARPVSTNSIGDRHSSQSGAAPSRSPLSENGNESSTGGRITTPHYFRMPAQAGPPADSRATVKMPISDVAAAQRSLTKCSTTSGTPPRRGGVDASAKTGPPAPPPPRLSSDGSLHRVDEPRRGEPSRAEPSREPDHPGRECRCDRASLPLRRRGTRHGDDVGCSSVQRNLLAEPDGEQL